MKRSLSQVAVMVLLCVLPALATAWWHPRSPYRAVDVGGADAEVALAEDEVALATVLA